MSITRDDMVRILREARERGATEVHFKVPNRPQYRVEDVLLPVGQTYMTPASTLQIAMALCSLANLELPLASMTDTEFSFGLNGVGRFQVSLYRQRGSIAICVQRSALDIPNLAELGLGLEAERVLDDRGLVLIAGGRRRAALMATLIDRYNATNRGHVIELADPLLYLHRDAMASIAQRGVGTDVASFAAGVRTAIRQRPDVLAVGEVRDRETTDAVLDALEHGIFVIATVTAPRAADATSWLTRNYLPIERPDAEVRVRRQLSAILCIPDAGASELVTMQGATAAPLTARRAG